RKRPTPNLERPTSNVEDSDSSAFSVGRSSSPCVAGFAEQGWTLFFALRSGLRRAGLDVSFICSFSATLPSRPRARIHLTAALPCAGGGRLPCWRYSSDCCNRRQLSCRAPIRPEIAAAIHSTGLHSKKSHPERDRSRTHRPA